MVCCLSLKVRLLVCMCVCERLFVWFCVSMQLGSCDRVGVVCVNCLASMCVVGV